MSVFAQLKCGDEHVRPVLVRVSVIMVNDNINTIRVCLVVHFGLAIGYSLVRAHVRDIVKDNSPTLDACFHVSLALQYWNDTGNLHTLICYFYVDVAMITY